MSNLVYSKFSVVIPAFNEGKTFPKVLIEALMLKEVDELIFVNDGSTDDTDLKIKKFQKDPRFVYIKHARNKGKGVAIKSGINKVKNEVILLLDADLGNITAQKIKKIAMPVLKGEVDFSRGSFDLTRGRVTEIAVKPMMKILFPDLSFDQPISGQVCAKKTFLENVNLEQRWGVDIGILLDAIEAGQRIVEVDIGKLEHKAQSDQEKAEMAQQVMETLIRKAGLIQHKYKLVVFTIDDTLINQNSIDEVFEKIGVAKKVAKNRQLLKDGDLTFRQYMLENAKLFEGVEKVKVEKACSEIPLVRYSLEVISALKKRKYRVAIISPSFSAIIAPLSNRFGIDLFDCTFLEERNGKFSGRITSKSIEKWLEIDEKDAFHDSLSRILARTKTKPSETIMVAHSPRCIDLFTKIGLSIAYRPNDYILREIADKTISILPEILAIIE